MVSENPNVSLGTVDCSLWTRRIVPMDDYHKKRKDLFAYSPVQFRYMEILAKTFIFRARQNQLTKENIFNNAPVHRNAIAMNTNCAFTTSYTESPFWYQKVVLRQFRLLRAGEPVVDFDAAENCRHPQFQLIISKTTVY